MAAKIPCTYCKKKIDASASRCPYCQGEYTAQQVSARSKTANQSLAAGCVVLLVAVSLIGMCSGSGGISEPAADASPEAGAKADVIAMYENLLGTVRPCDTAAKAMADAASTGDEVQAYRAASNAADICLSTSGDIRKIEVPTSIGGENYKELKSTMETCENAYIAKWSAAKGLTKALDGDRKASVIADLQDTAQRSQMGTLSCVAGIVGVATKLGAKPEELPGAEASK